MNAETFTAIVQQLRPTVAHIGHEFFPHSDEAEDVMQETFMRLWLLRDQLLLGETLIPLARKIARNVCISMWRRSQLRVAIPLDEATPVASAGHADTPLMEKESNQVLEEAIAHLTPSEKRLFLLRQDPELDIRAIATITGMNERSVSARLSTARRKIYQYIMDKNR